jgi:LPXTG-motif cell wall-anchored protein
MTRALIRVVMSGAFVFLAATFSQAQTAQTGTTTETKKFQIIAVDGNTLVVRLPEGTRELTVPDDFRFNIDGKALSVHELKPGMAGTANITTRTTVTPVTVTEVKNGTVTKALGTAIVVATDGTYKMFSQSDIDKRGIKIMKGGQPVQISDLRENDRLSATIITTMPPKVLTEKEVQATLAGNPPAAAPAAPRAAAPAPSTAAAAPPPAAAQAPAATSGGTPKKLPKTASPLPVLGLTGLASLLAALGLTVRRRRATH